MIQITKRPIRLTDLSVAHDVIITDVEGRATMGEVQLHCFDEKSADHLVEIIRNAIVNYTVELPVTVELEIG